MIGYGTQKKVNLTGAVAAVSAEDLASKPVMSTAQATGRFGSRFKCIANFRSSRTRSNC